MRQEINQLTDDKRIAEDKAKIANANLADRLSRLTAPGGYSVPEALRAVEGTQIPTRTDLYFDQLGN